MSQTTHADCTCEELHRRISSGDRGFALVDVRTAEELAMAALPGVQHIPLRELPQQVDALEPWRHGEVIVMCHHGMRSASAQDFLISQGFQNVRNLVGGIDRYSVEADPSVPRYA